MTTNQIDIDTIHWRLEHPQNGGLAEAYQIEVPVLLAKIERLRAVLEQYADTANWVGHEWRGPTTNGWVLAARAL